jgi:hypothetical protein
MHSKLRWRFVLVGSVAIAVLISAALLTPIIGYQLQQAKERRDAEPHPVSATDSQQRAIILAILQENTYEGIPLPPPAPGEKPRTRYVHSIVLLNTSATFCGNEAARREKDKSCASPPVNDSITSIDFDTQIPRKLREELLLANRTSQNIPNPDSARVIFMSRGSVSQVFAPPDGWASFYKSFPHSGGFLEASRAVLSHDRTHALIYIAHRCDGVCGDGILHYLVLTGDTWHTEASVLLWSS